MNRNRPKSPNLPVALVLLLLAFALVHPASAQAPSPAPSPASATAAGAAAPALPPPAPLVGARQDEAAAEALVGTWTCDADVLTLTLKLFADGRFAFDNERGTYKIKGNQLTLVTPKGGTTYDFDLKQSTMVLRGGDLRADTTFVRQAALTDYIAVMVELSPSAIRHRLSRIGMVIVIVLFARLLISLLQALSQFAISNDWGPLGLIWRHNKARVRTIHSLVLNVIKYFIYFTALGIVLSELGINYATYVASLSVVGLAIGFGSQGLVQDMVTGFFVILEGQFDVGDMVELSGQTGVVTELGLRMTKVRNYLGQVVIIPNRNISVVGNYRLGSQLALVDVEVPNPADDARISAQILHLARELNQQFAGVLLNEPVVEGAMVLAPDARFLRLRVLFWPGQTWVVEQQLVPRVQALVKPKAEGAPAPRVILFYHPHEEIHVVNWRASLKEHLRWPRLPHHAQAQPPSPANDEPHPGA